MSKLLIQEEDNDDFKTCNKCRFPKEIFIFYTARVNKFL